MPAAKATGEKGKALRAKSLASVGGFALLALDRYFMTLTSLQNYSFGE